MPYQTSEDMFRIDWFAYLVVQYKYKVDKYRPESDAPEINDVIDGTTKLLSAEIRFTILPAKVGKMNPAPVYFTDEEFELIIPHLSYE
jgi:hypothetical protein